MPKARFFVAFLVAIIFFAPVVSWCDSQNQKLSALREKLTQRAMSSTPGMLALPAKKWEVVVKSLEEYLSLAQTIIGKKTFIKEDFYARIKAEESLIDALDKEIKAILNEERAAIERDFSPSIMERYNNFVYGYQVKAGGIKGHLEKLLNTSEENLPLEIEACLSFIKEKLRPPRLFLPSLPESLIHPEKEEKEPLIIIPEEIERPFSSPKALKAPSPELDIPTSADLAETPDIQLTQEIRDLASSLDNNPVKIFQWVHNHIDFIPTFGSFKGSHYTLLERSGNDWDTASLLMALLRVSNIPCRYYIGAIRLDAEDISNWIGVEDPFMAAEIIYSGGAYTTRKKNPDGSFNSAAFEHVWVKAYLPYGNYRGWQNDQSEKIWIPLDPSFKGYDYIEGSHQVRDATFDSDSYYQGTKTQSPIEYFQTQMETQGINLNQAKRTRTIREEKFEFLPCSLPYTWYELDRGGEFSILENRHRVRFGFTNLKGFDYFVSMPEAYGKRLTISYVANTAEDQNLIDQGKILIAKLKPVFKVEGIPKKYGTRVLTGTDDTIYNYVILPYDSNKTYTHAHPLNAGGYYSLALDTSGNAEQLISNRLIKLAQAVETPDFAFDSDPVIGEILYITLLKYFNDADLRRQNMADLQHHFFTKKFGGAVAMQKIETNLSFKYTTNAVNIETEYVILRSAHTPNETKRQEVYNLINMDGSFQEHKGLEVVFGVPAISAVKAIQIANQRGIPMHEVNRDNWSVKLGNLSQDHFTGGKLSFGQNDDWYKQNIYNFIMGEQGRSVFIPQTCFLYHDWFGVGWIEKHTNKAENSYIITGVLNGGETVVKESLRITPLAPNENRFKAGQPINCKAEAFDKDGKSISGRMVWFESGEGVTFSAGSGADYSFTPTKVGDYNIVATVFDDQGHSAVAMTSVKAGYGTENTQYDKTIETSVSGTNIPPEVMKGVIHKETGGTFKPNLTSKASARGLCQLTPIAIKELNRRYDPDIKMSAQPIDSTHPDWPNSVWNPEVNIKGGARYLQLQYKEFPEVPDTPQNRDRQRFALGAYNAGGYIKKGKKRIEKAQEDGKLLDKSPTDWDSIVWIGENEKVECKNKKGKIIGEWEEKQTIPYVDKIIGRDGGLHGYALKYDP